ncbi:MAG TPA: SpaA isopeptide-forming pilin-related protein, partial [Pyrinomonadaceae bacterium]
RKWLTTNVPANLRDGFYRDRKGVIDTLLKQAGAAVQSVMTDRNGTAFFTDLTPGTYVITNLVPTELGQSLATWNCELQIKPDDLAAEKPYLISNRKDRLVKCVATEKPAPPCQ